MPKQITASLLSDPDLAGTVNELQSQISRRFLPQLGQRKLEDAGRQYKEKQAKLFVLVSKKLGRGIPPLTPSDAIRAVNEVAIVYFLKCMWRLVTGHRYFPLLYVVWVTAMLCASAPRIYAGLLECEKSTWVIVGTAMAILCDVLEVVAVAITIICSPKNARALLVDFLLPVMGLAKFAGKLAKVGSQWMRLEAAGELAGESMLMYCRVIAILHSQPTWKIDSNHGQIPGNWLSPEEEIMVMGLIVDQPL